MSSLIISALCGLKDALNPCSFTTIVVLLLLVPELRKRQLDAAWYGALFIAVSFVSLLAYNLGVLVPFLYSDYFYLAARKMYLAAGIVLCLIGILHFRDWWMLRRPGSSSLIFPTVVCNDDLDTTKRKFDFKIIVLMIVLSVLLSALGTIWPMDRYVMLYSSFLLLPGKRVETYGMLFFYSLFLVLPLAGCFIIVTSQRFSTWAMKFPSVVKIVTSALMLSIGAGLIYVFRY
jgi:hypothetical protein